MRYAIKRLEPLPVGAQRTGGLFPVLDRAPKKRRKNEKTHSSNTKKSFQRESFLKPMIDILT